MFLLLYVLPTCDEQADDDVYVINMGNFRTPEESKTFSATLRRGVDQFVSN